MSNLAKFEFVALDITGKNYLSWVLDAEIHLDAKGIGKTIKEDNKATPQDKAKAMIFLRHHLHEGLKNEYLTMKDPQILWSNQRKAKFKITSQLKLCGENITDAEMLEKKYSTFHANNIVLQTQYREIGFKKYSELISCLLVAEQNNELLMKNHESHPTGSTPFPEANVTTHNGKETTNKDHSSSSDRGRGRARGQWCSQGRGRGYGGSREGHFTNSHCHKKWECRDDKEKSDTNICYCCGGKGHWSRVCRNPKHRIELYQESLKKGKKIEANLVFEDCEGDFDFGNTNKFDVADFLTSLEGNDFDFCSTTRLEVADFFIA
ncbi:uncharacterized protein LOC110686796 [Chenopodium quinoa]|uniref:uncharacterized protein LOC110686796 n=1 Tax=Chenopodium quinoa TaxID=63459 RepID=UPI000B77203F|nr:uncharacterized protein LOC110686796 [Chenopodium quinoa]